MSIFEEMAKAKVQGRGVRITEEGDFVVRIDLIKMSSSNQGLGLLWVTEFTIIEGTENNPPGSERSWVQMPEHRPQTDPGNIKGFLAALEGLDDATKAEFSGAAFERAVGEEQPYRGKLVSLSTQVVKTRQDYDFTIHMWGPLASDYKAPGKLPPPKAIEAPVVPPALTKERWLKGEGPATVHPENPAYEYHPEHTDWGVRPSVMRKADVS